MPFKTFANNDVLTAEEVNEYLMHQTIVQVSSQAESNGLPTSVRAATWGNVLYFRNNADVWQRVFPAAEKPAISLTRTSNLSLPATSMTIVTWTDSQSFGGLELAANAQDIEITAAGAYMFQFQALGQNTAGTAKQLEIKIFKNGSVVASGLHTYLASGVDQLFFQGVIDLAEADVISFRINNAGAGAANLIMGYDNTFHVLASIEQFNK